MFINGLINSKQNVVSIQWFIIQHREEWSTTNTLYNTDEVWKHYAKWKKADTKGHVLYDFISMKYPEQVIL